MTAMKKTPLEQIDAAAKRYSRTCEQLAGALTEREKAMQTVSDKHMSTVKLCLGVAQEARVDLLQLVKDNPGEFAKPKTRILHRIKVGFQKAPGRLSWKKGTDIVGRIEKQLPDLAEALVKIEKKPIKKALAGLTAEVLKKLGVTVEDAGEEMVCKVTDSDTAKLIKELLEGADAGDDE